MICELNDAVACIERHLLDDDPLAVAQRGLTMPAAHFHAMFRALSGMSPAEYVRRRRLSLASSELAGGAKVSDVAFRVGYDSLDGFTRAYKRWCGCTPTETARTGCVKTLPPIAFTISITGGTPMEHRIVPMPAFSFAGVTARVPLQFEGVNNAIVELARTITPEQREEMHRLQDIEPREVVNASWDSDTGFAEEAGELTHLIGVLTTADTVNCGLTLVPAPAGDWAVFPCEGPFPEAMQSTTARIYGEWLASSGWELRDSLIFSFTRHDSERPGIAYSEIWVPVTRAV